MSFWEHGKKTGRGIAMIFVLGITGSLSIIMALNDPTVIQDMAERWLLVLGPILAWYFSTKSPNDTP